MKLIEMSETCKMMYHIREILMLERNRPKPIFIDSLCFLKTEEDSDE
jgi:hypothetical protein